MRQNVKGNEVAGLGKNLPEQSNEPLGQLTDDHRLLVVSHMPLAYAMAWRMRGCGVSLEDLQQEGILGLCEAARRYDESANCTFAAYAAFWCRKMMLLAIRQGKRTADCVPDNLQGEDGDDDLLRIGQQHRIADALRCLEPKEELIVRHFYGLDAERLNLSEIARAMGISRSRVAILHQRTLRKLETALAERPLVDYLAPWLE